MRFFLVSDGLGFLKEKHAFAGNTETADDSIKKFLLDKPGWAAQEVDCEEFNFAKIKEVLK